MEQLHDDPVYMVTAYLGFDILAASQTSHKCFKAFNEQRTQFIIEGHQWKRFSMLEPCLQFLIDHWQLENAMDGVIACVCPVWHRHLRLRDVNEDHKELYGHRWSARHNRKCIHIFFAKWLHELD